MNISKFCIFLLTPFLSIFAETKKITITGNDTMQFDLKSFDVKAGEKVELTFKNIGKIPKIAMGHNLVILKKGISAISFGQKALGAGANATNALLTPLKVTRLQQPNFLVLTNPKLSHLPPPRS